MELKTFKVNMNNMKTKNIFKSALFTALLIGSTLSATAQVAGGSHSDLFDLYVMGDYEKCYDKAIKKSDKDDTKYDSEVYLWAAMSLLRIHEDPELREVEEYQNAVKDAIKLAAKFKKRDDRHIKKEEPHLFDDNIGIVNEFKALAISEARGYFVQDDFRKAAYYMRYGLRIDEDDPSMEIFKGIADILSRNKRVGIDHIENALKKFKKMAETGSFEANEATYPAFETGFIHYVKYLKENDEVAEASEVIGLARKLDPQNKKFENLAESL